MILIIISGAISLISIVLLICGGIAEETWMLGTGSSVLILLVLIIGSVWGLGHLEKITEYGEQRGFVYSFPAYEESIKRASTDPVVKLTEQDLAIGLYEFGQAGEITKLIKDKREAIVEYNMWYYRLKAIRDSKWINWFIPPIPEDLKPIEIISTAEKPQSP